MLDDEIAAYAETAGLSTFVLAAPKPAEYIARWCSAKRAYWETDRPVTNELERERRPRIKAPFRWFGHVICTQPDRLEGVFWCLDLLFAGYIFAHFLTPDGPRKVVLTGQLSRNILKRLGWQSRVRPSKVSEPFPERRALSYQPQSGRILMLSANLERGGTQRDMLVAAQGFVQRGYDVRIANFQTPTPEVPNFEREIGELGILPHTLMDHGDRSKESGLLWSRSTSFADLATAPQWFLAAIRRVARAIETHQPSIVHAWNDKVGLISALAAVSLGVPRVVVSLGSLPLPYHNVAFFPLLKPGYAAVALNANVALLNNSAAGAAAYERWIGLQPGTIRIVRNAFLREYQRSPLPEEVARFRAALNITTDQRLVGAVMRLAPEKDPSLWLATAAAIAKSSIGRGVCNLRLWSGKGRCRAPNSSAGTH